MKKNGSLNSKRAYKTLIINDYNWYIVEYADRSFDLKHQTALSSILQCGADPADFGILILHQCQNGEELDDCPPWTIL